MLSYFFQIAERTLQLFKECSLSTKCRSFKQFASIKRISIFHQSNIIGCNVIYNILCFVNVTQCQLIMISVVKNVHQISIEWMNIIQLWECIDDSLKFFIYSWLHEFYFSHVKLPDSWDLESSCDLSWSFSLCFRQSNINQLGGWWNLLDGFEIIAHIRIKLRVFKLIYNIKYIIRSNLMNYFGFYFK